MEADRIRVDRIGTDWNSAVKSGSERMGADGSRVVRSGWERIGAFRRNGSRSERSGTDPSG